VRAVAEEARLEQVGNGLSPVTEGWFVLNAHDAPWVEREAFGRRGRFELDGRLAAGTGREPVHFEQLGVTLAVLEPGKPSGLYHGEAGQEDFLVLSGECIAIVEDEERRLRQWDFLHCPPWTNHILVGAGDGPCIVLMTGARVPGGIRYPVSAVAARYGASAEQETDSPREAYASFGHWLPAREKPSF
jgi:uncharacterized cupin superfamily protein